MDFIYPAFFTFLIVFISELGDKTQLLVLSFSTKSKAKNILLGVAIGTFFSHGLAILFGSNLGSFNNDTFNFYLKVFAYASFLLFGIIGFIPKREKKKNDDLENNKLSFLQKISKFRLNYIFIIALSIFVGEIGDKTFISSLGLGVQYPDAKISLIIGSILGMVASNSIAIFFGKLLGNKLKQNFIQYLSNVIFIIFGIVGFITLT